MEDILVYPAGTGEALIFAQAQLKRCHIPVTDHPTPEVTHLLLDVPTREICPKLLERLPEKLCVVGGKLERTELKGYRKLDLLADEEYLAKNAAITADCALRVAAMRQKTVFSGTDVLVIGWGRIGKCLAQLLRAVGCRVTVAARKPSDRAVAEALGYQCCDIAQLENVEPFSLIYNTVPKPVMNRAQLSRYPKTLKIDLASTVGLEGDDVIHARGLPGIYAPESSGKLITEIFLKRCREGAV